MTAIEVLGKIVLIVIVILGVVGYVQYRIGLNKEEESAKYSNKPFNKPKIRDEFRLAIYIIIGFLIFGGIVTFIWKVLYILGIAEQNPEGI